MNFLLPLGFFFTASLPALLIFYLLKVKRKPKRVSSTFLWRATVEDTTTWSRPWSFAIPWTEDDTQPIHEYACHEGNYGLRNILSAGRSDDRKGIKSSNNVDAQADLADEDD